MSGGYIVPVKPENFRFQPERLGGGQFYDLPVKPTARRSRLLRFLAPWTAPGGGYPIRVGRTRLSAEVLSDDALEDLAARVVSDFWADRRRTRLNRPFYVAALLGMETTRAA